MLSTTPAYLCSPVRDSVGCKGHNAALIVRPSSNRRLYVLAALRWCQLLMRTAQLTESMTSSWIPKLEM